MYIAIVLLLYCYFIVVEARFIHNKLGDKKRTVWKNVVVIANLKLGVEDESNFRGVKSAITEVTDGDPVILENVKFLQYRLVKVLYCILLYCTALYCIL